VRYWDYSPCSTCRSLSQAVALLPIGDTLLLRLVDCSNGSYLQSRPISSVQIKLCSERVGAQRTRLGDNTLDHGGGFDRRHPRRPGGEPFSHPAARLEPERRDMMQRKFGIAASGIVVRQTIAPAVTKEDLKIAKPKAAQGAAGARALPTTAAPLSIFGCRVCDRH
jgi:hypothetical protein